MRNWRALTAALLILGLCQAPLVKAEPGEKYVEPENAPSIPPNAAELNMQISDLTASDISANRHFELAGQIMLLDDPDEQERLLSLLNDRVGQLSAEAGIGSPIKDSDIPDLQQ